MGWCSGTKIFDAVCEAVLDQPRISKKDLIKAVAEELEEDDWDCQQDSNYYDHPLVKEVMKELHPNWEIDA